MPELPEIISRVREMNLSLPGKKINAIEVLQPKCLNLTPEDFINILTDAIIEEVTHHGKWIRIRTSLGWLLVNLGMGGEILLTTRQKMPAKYRLVNQGADGDMVAEAARLIRAARKPILLVGHAVHTSRTGAAVKRLVVKTPAATAGDSEYISARSSLSR